MSNRSEHTPCSRDTSLPTPPRSDVGADMGFCMFVSLNEANLSKANCVNYPRNPFVFIHASRCVGPTLIKLIFGRACSCLKPKDILSRLTIKENSSLRGMNDVAYIPIDSILCEISVHIERQAYQQSIVKFLQRHRFRYMPRRGKGTDFDNLCEGSMSDTPIKYIQLIKTFFKKLQTYAHRVDIGMYHVYHSHHHRHQIIQISNIESC